MHNKDQLLLEMLQGGADTALEIMDANTFGNGITRRAFLVVEKRAHDFVAGKERKTWLAMPGLRGTGKSTLLSQMYNHPILKSCTKIFASFDRVKTINADINDFIQACEQYIGGPFESHDRPIALFLDEVQYLENWAVGLKTVLDRSSNIFIFCTGSSALSLQTNPDVARRIDFIKLHPLCFTEYVMIKQAVTGSPVTRPIYGLARGLRDAVFFAQNAEDSYSQLSALSRDVSAYWRRTKLGKTEAFSEFLKYGTLPFTLSLANETVIWDRINRILSESLDRDVTQLGKFDTPTVGSLTQLLFLLASSVEVSINRLSSTLRIDERTVTAVLKALEKTEIITAIPPKGAHNGKVRKPSKYLFTSPAMRAALCNFGGIVTPENSASLKGKLLEDLIGFYLKRLFLDSPIVRAVVEYDTSKGGADFIISPDGLRTSSIALEVGANKTTNRQAIKTLEDLKGRYGIVVTSGNVELDRANNIVKIPFEYFLLI